MRQVLSDRRVVSRWLAKKGHRPPGDVLNQTSQMQIQKQKQKDCGAKWSVCGVMLNEIKNGGISPVSLLVCSSRTA